MSTAGRIAPPAVAALAGTALAVAALALGACGFRLQGHTPLPSSLKAPYLDLKDRQSEFSVGLRRALESSGAQLSGDRMKATAVVQVLQDQVSSRVIAVSPPMEAVPNGMGGNLPIEYELSYTVRFTVNAEGKELLPPQEVTASRDYSFDEHVLLAKDNEQAILREALAHNLVSIVMRRLSSL